MSRHSNKYRPTPSDPAEAARRRMEAMTADAKRRELEARAQADPANWGLRQDMGDLTANDDVNVSTDVAGKLTRAKRWDVFTQLRNTFRKGPDGRPVSVLHGGHMINIDKLHELLAIRHRTAGASGISTPIDGSIAPDFPKASVEAGVKVDGLFAFMDAQERAYRLAKGVRLPPYRAALLLALSEPEIAHGRRVNNWRKVVKDTTGEFRDRQQVDEVVAACDALGEAFNAGAPEDALEDYYRRRRAA